MSDLQKNPWEKFEDQIDGDIPSATLQIYSWIGNQVSRPQDTYVNRASSATMCVRRRWYQKSGTPGTPLTPRKQVNFLLGDLSEKTLLYFVRQALVGPGKLYSEINLGNEVGSFKFNGAEIKVYDQKTFTWKITDELSVTAHVDGLGKRNSDGKWELIECKSASNYGYDDFKQSGPGDYLKQAHACMQTKELTELDVKEVRYFYLRKETGHIWDLVFKYDPALANEVKADYIQANLSIIPERPYGPQVETFRNKPTGRTILPFQCVYCSFTQTCFPAARKEFKSGQFGVQKPVFVIDETKGETNAT